MAAILYAVNLSGAFPGFESGGCSDHNNYIIELAHAQHGLLPHPLSLCCFAGMQ